MSWGNGSEPTAGPQTRGSKKACLFIEFLNTTLSDLTRIRMEGRVTCEGTAHLPLYRGLVPGNS